MTGLIHRDSGVADKLETICSVPNMKVHRYRMRKSFELKDMTCGPNESLLIPIEGQVEIMPQPGDERIVLERKDVCYLPRETDFSVQANEPAELIWAEAPAVRSFPRYVKRFSELKAIPAGAPSYQREVMTAIGESDPANRFIAGFVEGKPGNWTSFPPHRHDGKPEVYIYYGMGRKFGVQIVADEEERAYLVRDGDAVAFERGYHPNVASPTVGINFLWIISADPKARNLSVDVHPDYRDAPMGQTHLKIR
jgi:5-deoxy-glucuronate isomerase